MPPFIQYSHFILSLFLCPSSALLSFSSSHFLLHSSKSTTVYPLCPCFSSSNILTLSLLYRYLSVPPLPLATHPSLSLSNTLSLSLSIIHGAVTVGIKGPRKIATATTQQKQPHWIMGNWVTSQEREGAGGAAEGGRCHTHTPDRCPTKQEDRKEGGDERERQRKE